MVREKQHTTTLLEWPDMTYYSPDMRNSVNNDCEKLETLAVALNVLDSINDTETILLLSMDVNTVPYLEFTAHSFYVYVVTGGFCIELYDKCGDTTHKIFIDSANKIYALCQGFMMAKAA